MNFKHKKHPTYDPGKWNDNICIKKSHNCYAYALNIIDRKNVKLCCQYLSISPNKDCRPIKPQLGIKSGTVAPKYTRANLEHMLLADNPNVRKFGSNKACPLGFYRIMLFFTPDGNEYHFYRQDNDGKWSHKDGSQLATNKDAKFRIIRNPRTADRGKYTCYCGCFIVPVSAHMKYMSNASPALEKIKAAVKRAHVVKK